MPAEALVGVAFSSAGELLVTSHFTGGISRFLFDAGGNAIPNGFIPTSSLGGVAILTVAPIEVAIDIKPGSFPNSINLSSAGVIPVAILSSDTFDATTVNPDTIFLASGPVKVAGKSGKFLCHSDDVNGDFLEDLVCAVETALFMIEPGQGTAELTGETFDGIAHRWRGQYRNRPLACFRSRELHMGVRLPFLSPST